jgi:hypothetical protein
MDENRATYVKRTPYTIKVPYTITDPNVILSFISEPVKFLMMKTLQYSLELEQYVENLGITQKSAIPTRVKNRRFSVMYRFYSFLLRNARFLKELFNLWELRKVEFLALFNQIRAEFLKKYQNELFEKLGYEETFELLEKLNNVAMEVVSERIPPSLDDIITEVVPSKTLRKKLKELLKEDAQDEDTVNQ